MNAERQISWQEQQLRRFMAKHADDLWSEHLSVKLSNPEEEREIDEVILQELWPGVVQALHGSRLTTRTGGNNTPAEGIEPLHHQYKGAGRYQVAVNTGEGAGWGLHGKAEAREYIRETVEDHLKVIAAMERFERTWKDTKGFNTLADLVVRVNLSGGRLGPPRQLVAGTVVGIRANGPRRSSEVP